MKAALITGILALSLIVAGGVVAAIGQIQGAHAQQCKAAVGLTGEALNTPQILDVRVGQNATDPVLELGRTICVTVAGIQSVAGATKDVQLALFIDGQETPARAIAADVPEPQTLLFNLRSAADAKSDEAVRVRTLLGGLLSGGSRDITIGVGLLNTGRPFAEWPTSSAAHAYLKVYSPEAAITAGIGFALLLVTIYLAGRTTSLLRDGDANSTYSLSRVQMAFWMIVIVFAFTFIWVLTHQYLNVVTSSTFTLLGITGATAIASRAIDAQAPPQASQGFFADIVCDAEGPQLHRVQILIWTLVLGTIFVWNVLDALVLTDFDANLLILLGIANGVYAGFKTQEATIASASPATTSPAPSQ